MKDIKKHYQKGDLTVVWQPKLCIHSTNCFRGLPDVFDPSKRPWVTPEGSTEEMIMQQINKCPSGALSYISTKKAEVSASDMIPEITISGKGPYLIKGNITLTDEAGNVIEKNENFA